MSLARYIVLKHEIPGLDSMVNGKALANAANQLDSFAAEKEVQTLMSFFSAADGELANFASDHDARSSVTSARSGGSLRTMVSRH